MAPGDNVPFVSMAPKVVASAAQNDQQWVLECLESLQWKRGWPELKDGNVIGRLNTKQWPQVYHFFPNAVLAKATDARAHHLSGRKLYIVCPTRWFTDIMIQAFGGAYPPCPREDCPCNGSNRADDTTHTFSSADAELQLMLPACIHEQYDVQLSARSGVSSDLCDMILATAAKGHTNVKSSQSSIYQSIAKAPKARKIPDSFGSFDAAGGYGGHVPGSQYMADICKTSARGTAATGYYNRMMCGIKGTTMCADHCHKPSKCIRQNGERASGAFWTCANAQVQIMGQYAVRSKSLAEIKVPLTRMHSRLVKLQGTEVVQTLIATSSMLRGIKKGWVDDPAVSDPTLREVWDSLDTLNDDLFHWLQRLLELIPAGHSAKRAFAKDIASSCYGDDKEEDLMLLKTALEKEGKWTAAEIIGALLQGKVRRYIPDKVTLASKVTAVMLDYKDVVNTQNQLPLFSTQVWEQFFRNLAVVQKGLLSDPSPLISCTLWSPEAISWCGLLFVAPASLRGTTSTSTVCSLVVTLVQSWLEPGFAIQWQMEHMQGIENNGDPDYGMFDHSLIEELQTCYATTTAVDPYKSFKPPPVVADEKFLFDWDDQVGNAFEFELCEDDMPEGDVEGEEPVFELLSGGLDAEETRKEAAGKAAKQSCVDVLHQVEQIRPGFLAELGAVKHTSESADVISQSEMSPYHKELVEELDAFVSGAGKDWMNDAWAAGPLKASVSKPAYAAHQQAGLQVEPAAHSSAIHGQTGALHGSVPRAVALSHVPTLAPSPVPSPAKKPRSAAGSTQGTLLILVAQPAAVAGSGPSASAPSGSSGAAATGKHCCDDCWVHDWWIACVGTPQFGNPGRIDPWNTEKIPTTRTNHKKVCTNKGLFDSIFLRKECPVGYEWLSKGHWSLFNEAKKKKPDYKKWMEATFLKQHNALCVAMLELCVAMLELCVAMLEDELKSQTAYIEETFPDDWAA
ncbi:TPA: hypothetical protein ACH3X1_015684 [Trebouxia sp. C0004]